MFLYVILVRAPVPDSVAFVYNVMSFTTIGKGRFEINEDRFLRSLSEEIKVKLPLGVDFNGYIEKFESSVVVG